MTNPTKKSTWALCLAIAVILLCLLVFALWAFEVMPHSVVTPDTFIGACVALLGVIVTMAVGWQIYNAIEVKEKIAEIDRLQQKQDKARFRHEEQLLRFFAFYNNLDNYNGSLASFLNDYMEDNMTSSEAAIEDFKNLINRTIKVASKIKDLSLSINIRDAVFVGVAKNLDYLEAQSSDVINGIYQSLLGEKEFSAEEMQEGLSSKDKVKNRINCAISVFAE